MLTAHRRTGATLVELLVALTLAALVLGTATGTLLRQQRAASSLGRAADGDAQVRAALGAMAVELSALTAGSGDLAPGQASDTAVQLRGLIASGLACADGVASVAYTGEGDASGDGTAGITPRVGDSLWWFGGDPPVWRGRRIVGSDSVWSACPLTSAPSGPVRRVVIAESDSIGYGAPLRITRPIRYAFYRSGDGSWQLGMREWSDATGRFAAPQPIAGPFTMRAGRARTGFRFFDAEGRELGLDGAGVAAVRVARVRVSAIAADRIPSGVDPAVQGDSVDVALQAIAVP